MQDLIERLEKAMGPDRGLDADIAILAGWTRHPGDNWIGPTGGISVPAYTASIDAALTLVNRDELPILLIEEMPFERFCRLAVFDTGVSPPAAIKYDAYAETIPLAICIAALKARVVSSHL